MKFCFSLVLIFSLIVLSCSVKNDPVVKEMSADEIIPTVESFKGEKAVLVNVWATWCGPCVEEFPDIVELRNAYSDNLEVIFISADFPEQTQDVLKFLKKQNVDWTTYLKNDKDEIFINSLDKSWTGSIPFTAIYSKSGDKLVSWEDQADKQTFEKHIKQAITL